MPTGPASDAPPTILSNAKKFNELLIPTATSTHVVLGEDSTERMAFFLRKYHDMAQFPLILALAINTGGAQLFFDTFAQVLTGNAKNYYWIPSTSDGPDIVDDICGWLFHDKASDYLLEAVDAASLLPQFLDLLQVRWRLIDLYKAHPNFFKDVPCVLKWRLDEAIKNPETCLQHMSGQQAREPFWRFPVPSDTLQALIRGFNTPDDGAPGVPRCSMLSIDTPFVKWLHWVLSGSKDEFDVYSAWYDETVAAITAQLTAHVPRMLLDLKGWTVAGGFVAQLVYHLLVTRGQSKWTSSGDVDIFFDNTLLNSLPCVLHFNPFRVLNDGAADEHAVFESNAVVDDDSRALLDETSRNIVDAMRANTGLFSMTFPGIPLPCQFIYEDTLNHLAAYFDMPLVAVRSVRQHDGSLTIAQSIESIVSMYAARTWIHVPTYKNPGSNLLSKYRRVLRVQKYEARGFKLVPCKYTDAQKSPYLRLDANPPQLDMLIDMLRRNPNVRTNAIMSMDTLGSVLAEAGAAGIDASYNDIWDRLCRQ